MKQQVSLSGGKVARQTDVFGILAAWKFSVKNA